MKRLLTAMLVSALVVGLAPNPAGAAERQTLSRKQSNALCTEFFAEDRCAELASEWHVLLTQQPTHAAARTLAKKIVAGANATREDDIPCEAIFSERVCALLREIGEIADDPVGFVLGVVVTVLQIVREEGGRIVKEVVCLIDPDNPVCWTRSASGQSASAGSGDRRVCREIFSDAVCDTIENPRPLIAQLILYVWNIVQCNLDPACWPIVIQCDPPICNRAYRPSYAF
ncbi:MAG: hypothetical protein M3271_05905 [Actinomycetota bacterium]|nr:hypothetical protein [Actinomycetota bacterium]